MNYAELPDAEIVSLCGTQVMGWPSVGFDADARMGDVWPRLIENISREWVIGRSDHDWKVFDPLTSDADAFMLVDAIHAQGKLWFRLTTRWDKVNWSAGWTEQDFTGWNGRMDIEETNPDRRRAICIAALRATAEEAANA